MAHRNELEKIVVNVGIGKMGDRAQFKDKLLPAIMKEVAMITGQQPSIRPARKAIANFKTRVGDPVGLQVTLRGRRMEDFFERLVHVVLPRVKDFRGLDLKNVDARGNLNIGFREQYVFPEIHPDHSIVAFGLQVTIVPLDRDRERAIAFYRAYKVPLKK